MSVGGPDAKIASRSAGVMDWTVTLSALADGKVVAFATDDAGNVEKTGYEVVVLADETTFNP